MAENQKFNYTELIASSLNGNQKSLETLIKNIQDKAYNLSARYLWNTLDAEDATQEILLKVLTNLSKFRGESSFTTWVYRVATNYLLNMKRTLVEDLTFEEGEQHLKKGMGYPAYEKADTDLLEEEVKIACSTSMLICVSRPLRLTYFLGEILEFDSNEGAYILEIEPATFRKRLSFARKRIRCFMANQCGIYDPKNPCRCSKQINYCLEVDWFKPNTLKFADKGKVEQAKREIETFMSDAAIFQSHPYYATPDGVLESIKSLLNNNNFPLLINKK
ncbi:MAG: RNA polymerase sigma factor [Cyclobacteriaceae bacterium]